uniref:Core-binding (CB) domain-containing protein n=2 Tax=Streptomyces sp. NBC_01401 TaxID=2903854 RepID=A0AAU3HB57_9ACTN
MPPTRTRPADASTAISHFLDALETRGYVYETRRLRAHFLNEYLEHALREQQTTALPVDELMDLTHAGAWLAAAAAGRTRSRNTLTGPDTVAAGNTQRTRIQTWNSFAEHLGLPLRLEMPPAAHGDWLEPEESHRLLRTLAVKRPVGSNAATAIRTAAVAALVAATGRSVPDLHRLDVADLDLAHRPVPRIVLDTGPHPLDKDTADILRRWLDVRAGITRQLEGSDPGYLWIPTKPGRPRGGEEPPKPGLTRAAVRTLHSAHRNLVLQVFGAPLRPGALLLSRA